MFFQINNICIYHRYQGFKKRIIKKNQPLQLRHNVKILKANTFVINSFSPKSPQSIITS